MQFIIYFLIVLFATTVGAATGMGGGVIIKPVLDVLGDFDVETIGILSSSAVLTMSIVSVSRQVKSKAKINVPIATSLAIGSVVGGSVGNSILSLVLDAQPVNVVKIIQNVFLAILLVVIFFYMLNKEKIKTYQFENIPLSVLIGFILGNISSFLGIGGGPINVVVFIFLFSYDTKSAAVSSLITILFAQISKLGMVALTTGFTQFDLSMLLPILVAAVLGGSLGATINKKLPEKKLDVMFNAVQVIIFIIAVYNIYVGFTA